MNLKTRLKLLENRCRYSNINQVVFLPEGQRLQPDEVGSEPFMIVPIFKNWEATAAKLQDQLIRES